MFSPASNSTPADGNGAWSYGYENFPIPNAFNLLTIPAPIGVLDSWQSPAFGQVAVIHNGTAANQLYTLGGDNGVYQSGQLGMHPGPNDQYGVVQFTATTPGFYTIQGAFEGLDSSGLCNTFAYLWLNNAPVTPLINVTGFDGPFPANAGPFFLNVGDTLAYAAGGNPAFGSTGLVPGSAFVAAAVPEPSAVVPLGSALLDYSDPRFVAG